ncbi:hypothetical protein SOVF_100770, partial [Spinacia oleracea]
CSAFSPMPPIGTILHY